MKHNPAMRCLTIFLLLFCCHSAEGYYYKQYTTSAGLISNNVYHTIRDRKGYMWFFTDKGVSKFDGATFKNFTASQGLGDQDIFSGYEDKRGRLWLFTFNGNPCFIKDDKIHNADNDSLLKKLPAISYMESIVENDDSSIYIGYTCGELIRVRNNDFQWIIKDRGNVYDISSMNRDGDTLKLYGRGSVKYLINDKIVRSALADTRTTFHDYDLLLFADDTGVRLSDNQQKILWEYNDSYLTWRNIMHLYYDHKGHFFCQANNGITIIDIKYNTKQSLFSNIKTSCVCEDLYGNYWVSTLGDGVFYLNKNLERIKQLKDIDGFRTVTVNNGQTFFTNGKGTAFFENDSLRFVKPAANISIDPLYVNDHYFFYCTGANTFYLNRKSSKINTINVDKIKYVYPAAKDHFLLVGADDIYDLNIAVNNGLLYKYPGPSRIYQSCFSNGTLYFSSNNALYKYNTETHAITKTDSLNYPASVSKMYVIQNELVVTTNGENVIYYTLGSGKLNKRVVRYPFACYGIQQLNNGRDEYILNTDKGYYIFKDIDSITRNIQMLEYPLAGQDILSLDIIGKNAIYGFNNNYYSFDDSLMNREKKQPRFFIEKIMINGTVYPSGNVAIKNSGHTALSIELSYLKFDLPAIDYEYRVVYNNDTGKWVSTENSRLDIFMEKYGKYIVEIRAVTKNKITSESRYLLLDILPSFYYSFGFYTLVFTALLLVIIFTVRRYNHRRVKIFQSELNYLQLEHRAINSLLNPHFIFNAINNIQNLINIDSKDTANNYLAVLSKLIRQNIDNLQFSFIPVTEELNLIRNYIKLQNLRFDNKINLIINGHDIELGDIQIPPLLIHTFVENSVVHGFRKDIDDFTISVDLAVTVDDYLIIKIADNGVGLQQKNNSVIPDKLSLGIDFMRKRLTRISDFYKVTFSLDIRNIDSGRGTEVVVTLYAKFNPNFALGSGCKT